MVESIIWKKKQDDKTANQFCHGSSGEEAEFNDSGL